LPKSSENCRLSEKQKLAIIAFLSSGRKSFKEIAKEVGVSERTLRYWRNQPHFRAVLEEAFTTLTQKGIEAHNASMDAVLDCITSIARSPFASFRERLDTAKVIFNYRTNVVAAFEFAQRIQKLEKDMRELAGAVVKVVKILEQNDEVKE
jgi:transposase